MADPPSQILDSSYSITLATPRRLHFDSLRRQVDKNTELLARDMQIGVTDSELSSIFGRTGSWSQVMITEHLQFEEVQTGLCTFACQSVTQARAQASVSNSD
jgi:hypothetical protein